MPTWSLPSFIGLILKPFQALLDTGAQHGVVGKEQYDEIVKFLAEKFKLRPRMLPTNQGGACGVGGGSLDTQRAAARRREAWRASPRRTSARSRRARAATRSATRRARCAPRRSRASGAGSPRPARPSRRVGRADPPLCAARPPPPASQAAPPPPPAATK